MKVWLSRESSHSDDDWASTTSSSCFWWYPGHERSRQTYRSLPPSIHEVQPAYLRQLRTFGNYEKNVGFKNRFHKRLQPQSQSQVHLAVWGWWLTSWYIQSKGRKVVYDSFLFRLIVWNLCGLEDSRNLCDWLHCLGHAFLKETQLRAWHSTDFSLPKRDRSQIYKL